MNKTALVLEGGAMRGMFTAGILKSVYFHNIIIKKDYKYNLFIKKYRIQTSS